MNKIMVEYIWIDGHQPTAKLRSKTKVIDHEVKSPSDLPDWGFDGSSTRQADCEKLWKIEKIVKLWKIEKIVSSYVNG